MRNLDNPTYKEVRECHIELYGVGISSCKQAIVRRERGMAGPIAHNRENLDRVKCGIKHKEKLRLNRVIDYLRVKKEENE